MNKSLKNKLKEIAKLMRKYAEDCENDTCKDCRFSYFCGKGYYPSKIADTLEEVVELIGITVDALMSKLIDKDIKAVEELRGTMTDKQALEILKEWIEIDCKMIGDTPKSDYDEFIMRQDEALKIAIKALEKQAGELSSHSEKDIVKGCVGLMQDLMNRFEEYLDYIGFKPESEEERLYITFTYFKIVQRLLLFNTRHGGGTSTREKCLELELDDGEAVIFEDTRFKEDKK